MRRRRTPRALTLLLTFEAPVLAVRLETNVPAGHDRLTLSRVGPSGVSADVRGYSGAVVSPGPVVTRDYEVPLAVPLTYTATSWLSTDDPIVPVTATATIEIPAAGSCEMWLTDIAMPTNTQRIVIESLDELAYAVPIGVHDILGRRDPIVSGDVANTPTFELDFLTQDDGASERARATLGNGVPVLLRTPPADGIGSLYFAVTAFREQRIVKPSREQARRFVVNGVQVKRPDPSLVSPLPPTTYAEITAAYASYAELLAERPTYNAVFYNTGADEAGDVIPWPPDDV